MNSKIPTGQKINDWTILDKITIKNQKTYWFCVCKCGIKKYVLAADIKANKSKRCFSCGIVESNKKARSCPLTKTFWSKILYNAKRRNINFDLSKEYAYNVFLDQDQKCVYTGIDLFFDSKTTISDGNASLDRINNNKGYVLDNIQWVHQKVNTIKMNLTEDDFLSLCHLISRNTTDPDKLVLSNISRKNNKYYNNKDLCLCGNRKLKTSKVCKECYLT